MSTNNQSRLLQKKLLVAQGALKRQQIQLALDNLRSELAGTNQAGAAGMLIHLMAGTIESHPLSSLLLKFIGDTRLTRWLQHIRRTLQISQFALDVYRAFIVPKREGCEPAIVRERTDGPNPNR